jgi:hypothetical protein
MMMSFNMRQTAVKFVPCVLNGDQKPDHFSVYKDLQDQAKKSETSFFEVIKGVKSWIQLKGQIFEDIIQI